jgi:hypothetical protein
VPSADPAHRQIVPAIHGTLIAHGAPEGADRRATPPFCQARLRRPTSATSVSSEDVGRATWAASPCEPVKHHLGQLAPLAPSVRSFDLLEQPTWPRSVAGNWATCIRLAGAAQPLCPDFEHARHVRARLGCGSVRAPCVSRTPAISCEAVPASEMVRRGHEPAPLPSNGAGESFVSFIALFGSLVIRLAASVLKPLPPVLDRACQLPVKGHPLKHVIGQS